MLHPLIQTWPVPSKTAESLLIRQEGDKVVYLNELRFKKNSELVLVKSVSEEKLPAAMAVRGIEATIDGDGLQGRIGCCCNEKSAWIPVVPGCKD